MSEKAKVLVIDNDEYERLFMEELVHQLDYEIRVATNGKSGIDIAVLWHPDIILLDTNLPDLTGIKVLKEFKSNSTLTHIPVLFTFENSIEKDAIEEFADETIELIEKPVRRVELLLRIDHLLQIGKYEEKLEKLKTEVEKGKKLLAKYFSDDLVEQILSEDEGAELIGKHQTASILFFDVRNSTGIGEKLEPRLFAEFLSEMFTDVMDLIYGHNGSVNKLLGDGILATFGCPIPTDNDALNSVSCALQIREYLETFNDVRPEYLEEPIRGGIGISRGQVFAGNVGSVRRIEYTVLGDPVNTASRLESLTKLAKVDILIDGGTRNALGNKIKVNKREFDIRGKMNVIDIYHLEDLA